MPRMKIYRRRDPVWVRRGSRRVLVTCGTVGPMLVTLAYPRRWIPRSSDGARMERVSAVLRVRVPESHRKLMYGDVQPGQIVGLLIQYSSGLGGREVLHTSRQF